MRSELPHPEDNPNKPTGQPDDDSESTSGYPDIEPLLRYRRARIAAGAGLFVVCAAFGVGQAWFALPDATVKGVIMTPDGQPEHAHNIDGGEFMLPSGTQIEVICSGPHGYQFGIESGEYSGDVADSIPRADIHTTNDPFSTAQAPSGPQDPLTPLRNC